MNDVAQLKRQIADYLRVQEGLSSARVLTAGPAAWREQPLRRAAVAVGVECVETACGGLGGYWGAGAEGSACGAAAVITLRFDLYAPPNSASEGAEALYEALCDSLMLRENPFFAQKLWCGEAVFDQRAGAWHATARAQLHAAILRREHGNLIDAFRLERVDEKNKEGSC